MSYSSVSGNIHTMISFNHTRSHEFCLEACENVFEALEMTVLGHTLGYILFRIFIFTSRYHLALLYHKPC